MPRQTHRTPGDPQTRLHDSDRPDRPDRLAGQSVAVVGAGNSGVAAAQLLVALGAEVVLVDHKPEAEWATKVADLQAKGVRLCGGERFEKGLDAVDLVIISPGVPPALRAFDAVRRRGVPIVGEVELASWLFAIPLIGVTGTNGKSTVVSLLGAIFQECGFTPFVGGNLGPPLTEAALAIRRHARSGSDAPAPSHVPEVPSPFHVPEAPAPFHVPEAPAPFHVIVAELSSFQLETIDGFHPHVAVLLNITPDHLDRYESFADYANAKARIFRNQTAADFAVLNADEASLGNVRDSLRGQLIEFSVSKDVPNGVCVAGEMIVTRWKGRQEELMPVSDIPLAGDHNVSNVLAALAAGMVSGCSPEGMRRAVRSFRGLPHVCEVVRERRGVTFINDSKGTNVDATLKAVKSLRQPFIIILGGQDKGRSEFRRLNESLKPGARHCIVLGESAEFIAQAIEGAGPISRVSSLAEAVTLAAELATPGDAVLFSPACASFDMFQDYRDRGRQFCDLVNALEE